MLLLLMLMTVTPQPLLSLLPATLCYCSTFFVLDGLLCYEPLSQALAALYRTFYGLRDKDNKAMLVSSPLLIRLKVHNNSLCGTAAAPVLKAIHWQRCYYSVHPVHVLLNSCTCR
jgi:hypothetical protein